MEKQEAAMETRASSLSSTARSSFKVLEILLIISIPAFIGKILYHAPSFPAMYPGIKQAENML
jgi:hypothetical protein